MMTIGRFNQNVLEMDLGPENTTYDVPTSQANSTYLVTVTASNSQGQGATANTSVIACKSRVCGQDSYIGRDKSLALYIYEISLCWLSCLLLKSMWVR